MKNFNEFGLPETIVQSLQAMKFLTPTPIQAQAIPSILEGCDILGTAQTGTGKTAAYGIPLVAHLLNNSSSCALVLTPTRELAVQVLTALEQMLGKRSMVRSALLIGGDSMFKQLSQLRTHPRLIVGTPGRINDHLLRGSLNLSQSNFFVLDEMDRMLDMGFSVQIEKIVKFLPRARQTLMFSATMAPEIRSLANSYLKEPVCISIGSTTTPLEKIDQEILHLSETEKYTALLEQLNKRTGSVIIFVKTKSGTEKLAAKLRGNGHTTDAIHGDLRQRQRERAIQAFRNYKHRTLCATDIAARGLDIPHIETVINYDLPQCPEDFIHRVGRTGRAGAEGYALTMVTSQDAIKWKNICRLINPSAQTNPRQGTRKGPQDSKRRAPNNLRQGRPGAEKLSQRPAEARPYSSKKPKPEGGYVARTRTPAPKTEKPFSRQQGQADNQNNQRKVVFKKPFPKQDQANNQRKVVSFKGHKKKQTSQFDGSRPYKERKQSRTA